MNKQHPRYQRLYFPTYMSVIENAPGTNMFKHFYLRRPDGSEFDAIGDGDNACAFFVSSVLAVFGLAKGVHGTVAGTLHDLEESGWVKTDDYQPGDIISWEPHQSADGPHGHIGFYLGNRRAVSTSTSMKTVIRHDIHYGSQQRAVIAAYRYPGWDAKA